ncbi:hypothetical protein ACOSOMT5_P1324 [Acidiphilium sp. MT5]
MRDQYAGDVSDVLKFAFLRALAGKDRTLGIAWYYAPGDDGRSDGRHLEWRDETAWRVLDEELHTGLAALQERSVAALERAMFWPKAVLFHREPIPPRAGRSAWGIRKRSALDSADIVFLDPDNGIGEETEKHATFSKIRLLRKPGRAIVFITFPGRSMKHDALLRRLHERLAVETDAENIITLRTNVSVPAAERPRSYVQRQRWFTVIDPDAELIARARAFASNLTSIPRVRAVLDGIA